MPLFLSKPRTSTVSRNTEQKDTTFERSAPSGFRYAVVSRVSLSIHILWNYLAATALLIYANRKDKKDVMMESPVSSTFVLRSLSQCIPLRFPTVSVAFPRGRSLTNSERQLMEKYDARVATPVFRGNKQYHFHLLDGIDVSDIPQLMNLPTLNIPSPMDAISSSALVAYADILSVVSTALTVLRHGITTSGPYAGTSQLWTQFTFNTVEKEKLHTALEVTPDNLDDEKTAEKELGDMVKGVAQPGKQRLLIRQRERDFTHSWGSPDVYNATVGLALPYRKDFSTPDASVFYRFVNVFAPLFDKPITDDIPESTDEYITQLDHWWRREIHNTIQGEWLAHLMQTLIMARELGCSLFACVSETGYYQGSILGGGPWKLLAHGSVFSAISGDVLFREELTTLDAHRVSLRKIMDLMAMPANSELPKSMRRLRTIAIGAGLVGSVRASISELLPQLDFNTLPDAVNSTSLKDTLRTLADPSQEITEESYLAPEDFWTEDRFTLVLSRYGRRAPSLQTGAVKQKLTPNAHGPGVTSARPFSNKSLPLLQFRMVPTIQAASDWTYTFKHGLASIEESQEIVGPHVAFRGMAAQTIWNDLVSYVTQAVDRDLGQGASYDSLKRGRDDGVYEEEEGEVREPARKKGKSIWS